MEGRGCAQLLREEQPAAAPRPQLAASVAAAATSGAVSWAGTPANWSGDKGFIIIY